MPIAQMHVERMRISKRKNKTVNNDSNNDLSFSRIPFIKVLRAFAKQIRDDVTSGDLELDDVGGLRYTKQFTDRVWNHEKF